MAITQGGIDKWHPFSQPVPFEPLRRTKSKGIGPNTVIFCGENLKDCPAVDFVSYRKVMYDISSVRRYLLYRVVHRIHLHMQQPGWPIKGHRYFYPCPEANASQNPNPRVRDFTTNPRNASVEHNDLPFHHTQRPSMASKPAATCAICHENPSKYKCPTCASP
jgi:hypothetical protein